MSLVTAALWAGTLARHSSRTCVLGPKPRRRWTRVAVAGSGRTSVSLVAISTGTATGVTQEHLINSEGEQQEERDDHHAARALARQAASVLLLPLEEPGEAGELGRALLLPALGRELQRVIQTAGAPQYVGVVGAAVAFTGDLHLSKTVPVIHIGLALPLRSAQRRRSSPETGS